MGYFLFSRNDSGEIFICHMTKTKEEMQDYIFNEHMDGIKIEYLPTFYKSFDELEKSKPYKGFLLIIGEITIPKKIEVVTKYLISDEEF